MVKRAGLLPPLLLLLPPQLLLLPPQLPPQSLARMSEACSTLNFSPLGVSIASPAYLK